MGVKDLIKKMEELGRNGGEPSETTRTRASDLDTPAAPSSLPQTAPAPAMQESKDNTPQNRANIQAEEACEGKSEEAPAAEQAQPASLASTKPSENGAAAPENPEKKAKKVWCCPERNFLQIRGIVSTVIL